MGIFNFKKKKVDTEELEVKSAARQKIVIDGTVLEGNDSFSASGMLADDVLIDEGYASNTDVYAIISKLCEMSSDVPFVVEKLVDEKNDIWEVDTDSMLNDVVHNPSDDLTEKEFRYRTMLFLLSTGDFFWKKVEGGYSLCRKLDILESNLVDFNLDFSNEIKDIEYNSVEGRLVKINPEEVLHGLYYNPSLEGIRGKRGMSPLNAAYNSLAASNDRLTAMAHLYKNRGATNIISSGSDIDLDEDEREELQKNTDKILGGAKNFNKSIVTAANVNVNQVGMNANDLELVRSADLLLRDICKAFNVPSTMFSDQSASTLDNLKVGERLIYTNAIIPNNNKLITIYNKEIVPAYEKYENKKLRVRQLTDEIEALQSIELDKANKESIEVNTILSVLQSEISDEQKEKILNNLGYEL
jgi:HK97 family phage portal protein